MENTFIHKKIKTKHRFYKRSGGTKVLFIVVFILFALYAISLLFPFVWLLMSSLKTGIQFSDNLINEGGNTLSLPKQWMFGNYIKAFTSLEYLGVNYFGMLFNSVIYVLASAFGSIFFPAILGYCLSKYNFKLKGLIYGIGVFTMTVPVIGTLGASYKLITQLGLYDNYGFHIVMCMIGSFCFNYFIMYGFFKNLSWSYAEAVFVDGGGHFTAFFRVMLPQARAPMVILAIMAAVGAWNEYMVMVLYLPSMPTVASGLYYVGASLQRGNNFPVYYAALIISMIPIIVVFAVFADKMMQNMSLGGLKG